MVIISTNDIGFTDLSVIQNQVDGIIVVIDMYPVTYLFTSAIKFRWQTRKNVGDLPWDELLYVLVGAVIIGTVGNGGRYVKRTNPRSN